MSILGYSASYFLPEYWSNTPFYGEKFIPLLDYILSTDFAHTDKLATAFYNIESKYKNTADLPIEQIEALIEENGYGYIKALLGPNEDGLKLMVYLLVMIHELKGRKKGLELVLNLLKGSSDSMTLSKAGNIDISDINVASGFTVNDYVSYSGFTLGSNFFEVLIEGTTGNIVETKQCIASSPNYGFYLGINSGKLELKIGQSSTGLNSRSWQVVGGQNTFTSSLGVAKDTHYYIIFSYDGYEYSVKVSTDNKNFYTYILVPSKTPIDIAGGYIYLGVNKSGSISDLATDPFLGSISLSPFTVATNNVNIKQWFESIPVGEENTFTVDAALSGEVISATFFNRFSDFVKRYVYPTLISFKASLEFKAKLTFIPYVRQRILYVANSGDLVVDLEENNG